MRGKSVTIGVKSEVEVNREFVDAWKRAERGRGTLDGARVYFLDIATMQRVLSECRITVLRALHARGPSSIRRLAVELERDYRNVHDDVHLLLTAGLIRKLPSGRVVVPWDRVLAQIDLAA